jgi:hypothetical protein
LSDIEGDALDVLKVSKDRAGPAITRLMILGPMARVIRR